MALQPTGATLPIVSPQVEALYDDVPGQYYGIYFNQAEPSVIDYAVIKNGTSGIHVFNEGNNPSSYAVTVKNTKIFNHSSYGLFLFDDASIKGENLLIYKNGFHALLVLKGAKFNFNHCDFLGYGAAQSPAIGIRNYYDDPSIVSNIDEGKIYNSVLSGNIESELVLDTILTPSTFLSKWEAAFRSVIPPLIIISNSGKLFFISNTRS